MLVVVVDVVRWWARGVEGYPGESRTITNYARPGSEGIVSPGLMVLSSRLGLRMGRNVTGVLVTGATSL